MKLDCCFVGESQMSALLRCFSFGGTAALSPGSGCGEAGHGNSLYCLPPRSLFVHLPQYGTAGARKDFICLWPQLEESQFGKRQGRGKVLCGGSRQTPDWEAATRREEDVWGEEGVRSAPGEALKQKA